MPYSNPDKEREYKQRWFQTHKVERRKRNLENVKRYYQRIKSDPVKWEKFRKKRHEYHIKWYAKNANIMKERTRFYQNQSRFGGHQDKVLKRDKYKCRICGQSKKKIIIHHIDGNGRGKNSPNNSIDNLITLCDRCHIGIHIYHSIKNISLTQELFRKLG